MDVKETFFTKNPELIGFQSTLEKNLVNMGLAQSAWFENVGRGQVPSMHITRSYFTDMGIEPYAGYYNYVILDDFINESITNNLANIAINGDIPKTGLTIFPDNLKSMGINTKRCRGFFTLLYEHPNSEKFTREKITQIVLREYLRPIWVEPDQDLIDLIETHPKFDISGMPDDLPIWTRLQLAYVRKFKDSLLTKQFDRVEEFFNRDRDDADGSFNPRTGSIKMQDVLRRIRPSRKEAATIGALTGIAGSLLSPASAMVPLGISLLVRGMDNVALRVRKHLYAHELMHRFSTSVGKIGEKEVYKMGLKFNLIFSG